MKLETRVFELYQDEYSSLVELAHAMRISVSQIYRVRHGERPINEKFIIGAIKAFPNHRFGELFTFAAYLSPPPSTVVESEAHIERLDPYVTRALSPESIEVQRTVIGVLTILKSIAISIAKKRVMGT